MTDSERHDEYLVVRRRPWRRVCRTLILLAFSITAAVGGYMTGKAEDGFRFASVVEVTEELKQEWRARRQPDDDFQQQLTNLERGQSIDQQALRQARQAIAELESEIASLQADLIFYRNIMAPSQSTKGLQVSSLVVQPQRVGETYDFKLVLIQMGGNDTYISGLASVNVIGFQDEEKQAIPLRDLSGNIDNLGVKFRFRYFQDVEGELRLPEGFKPLEIQVIAEAEGAKSVKVERIFDWETLTEK
ncbi:MAG: hypothetical protein KGY54_11595 [Oleiphilaceae bacterium]|nr:hypothetical protein [Oleiphilaceae bacterium]